MKISNIKSIGFVVLVLLCGGLNAQSIITESSVPAEDIFVDDIIPKRTTNEGTVLAYESLREADIPYMKRLWRLIDTREKMNLVFRAEQAPFFNIVKELLENGEITAFSDEFFKEPLTIDQINAKLYKLDTIDGYDLVNNVGTIEVVKNTRDWRDVKKYRVKEIWYYDEAYSVLKNRIIGISPIFDEKIESADVTVELPLFWIYYPEARNLLAKQRVMNSDNDASPMSWADLLDNRFFSSYIYKKSNILDYKIADNYDSKSATANFDILLESEKIKQELFNFEHDLWEY